MLTLLPCSSIVRTPAREAIDPLKIKIKIKIKHNLHWLQKLPTLMLIKLMELAIWRSKCCFTVEKCATILSSNIRSSFSAVHFIALRDAKRLFKIPTCDWRHILTHDMFKISPKMTDRGLTDFTRNLSGVTVVWEMRRQVLTLRICRWQADRGGRRWH